jgi:hypothetical protein
MSKFRKDIIEAFVNVLETKKVTQIEKTADIPYICDTTIYTKDSYRLNKPQNNNITFENSYENATNVVLKNRFRTEFHMLNKIEPYMIQSVMAQKDYFSVVLRETTPDGFPTNSMGLFLQNALNTISPSNFKFSLYLINANGDDIGKLYTITPETINIQYPQFTYESSDLIVYTLYGNCQKTYE